MLINLKKSALSQESTKEQINITDRLPSSIEGPCLLNCEYTVQSCKDFYLLKLAIKGDVTVICQRCLNPFTHHHSTEILFAVCDSDDLAEKLMSEHECIVAQNHQLNLIDVLTDELYLYCPEIHPNLLDCDREVEKFIRIEKSPKN